MAKIKKIIIDKNSDVKQTKMLLDSYTREGFATLTEDGRNYILQDFDTELDTEEVLADLKNYPKVLFALKDNLPDYEKEEIDEHPLLIKRITMLEEDIQVLLELMPKEFQDKFYQRIKELRKQEATEWFKWNVADGFAEKSANITLKAKTIAETILLNYSWLIN